MAQYAKDLIEQSIQDIKYSRLNAKRKEIEVFLNYYTGTSISQYISPYFDSAPFQEVPPYEMNITKKFINKMSKIYTLGALRNVNKKYSNYTRKKNVSFKHIERMTRLLGTIATQVTYSEDKFLYHPIYFFIPHFDTKDPFNPIAISYPLAVSVDDPQNVNGEEYFGYIDDEYYIEYSSDGKILKEEYHGLEKLPVVFTHREHQVDSFFVEGATDIINCNTHVNITLTELQLGLRYQMFGQPYATGVPEAEMTARAGSDMIISLPEGSTFGIASPGGNLQSVIEAIKFQIELVAQSNHMFVQFAQDGGETPSGIALQIKDLENFEDFKDDIELWRQYENDFYEVEKLVGAPYGINLPNKFGIDFIEPEYPKSEAEKVLRDDWDLKNGQITLAEIMVRDNKDITIQEAEKKIEQNLEKNVRQLTTFSPPQLQNSIGEESENNQDVGNR
tara:strand:- start:1692 stop:3032 length:1341 start_codon:yes stop_codon:yes gene_type:complete